MENGASSYRHFLAGDDNGIVEIINEYKDGLILYLNQYVSDIHAAEDLESLSAEEECFEQACIREEEKRLVHKALKKLLSGAAAFCPVYLSGK